MYNGGHTPSEVSEAFGSLRRTNDIGIRLCCATRPDGGAASEPVAGRTGWLAWGADRCANGTRGFPGENTIPEPLVPRRTGRPLRFFQVTCLAISGFCEEVLGRSLARAWVSV